MSHSINRCRVCDNYLRGVESCKFCHFEWANDYPPCDPDVFDIFRLDDNLEWSHLQLLDRLYYKGIECLQADIWFDNNVAYLVGCRASPERVADALNLHKECVYGNLENGLVIINLFQEKYLRGELD